VYKYYIYNVEPKKVEVNVLSGRILVETLGLISKNKFPIMDKNIVEFQDDSPNRLFFYLTPKHCNFKHHIIFQLEYDLFWFTITGKE